MTRRGASLSIAGAYLSAVHDIYAWVLGAYASLMRPCVGLVLLLLSAGCSSLLPSPEAGIPITITNGDDEAAAVEVLVYDASNATEQTTREPFELAPGQSATLRLEPTRGSNVATHVIINGFVAATSDFLGCGPALEPPLPDSLSIEVLPNGEPDACP